MTEPSSKDFLHVINIVRMTAGLTEFKTMPPAVKGSNHGCLGAKLLGGFCCYVQVSPHNAMYHSNMATNNRGYYMRHLGVFISGNNDIISAAELILPGYTETRNGRFGYVIDPRHIISRYISAWEDHC